MSIKSINNGTNVPLGAGKTYIGKWDSVVEYSTAVILVNSDQSADLTIYQSPDKAQTYTFSVSSTGGTAFTKIFNITSPYIYFTLKNNSGNDMTRLQFEVIYRQVSVFTPGAAASSVSIYDSNGNNLNSTDGALNVYLTNALTIGGTVSVSNFPATQPVSGSVAVTNQPTSIEVSNFPATQTVSGTVEVSNQPTSIEVSNFPATQTVSGTVEVSNQPTSIEVSNFPATQTVSGTVEVSNQPTSIEVSNFPATQPVSGTVEVTGLVFSGDNLKVESTFLAQNLSNDNLRVSIQEQAGDALRTTTYSRTSAVVFDQSVTSGEVSNALSLNDFNVANISVYGNFSGTATIAVQFSPDNSSYFTTQYSVTQSAGDFGFTIPCAASFVRLRRTDAEAPVTIVAIIEAC